jgi:hypothetical protein
MIIHNTYRRRLKNGAKYLLEYLLFQPTRNGKMLHRENRDRWHASGKARLLGRAMMGVRTDSMAIIPMTG